MWNLNLELVVQWMSDWRREHAPCYNFHVAQAAAVYFGLTEYGVDMRVPVYFSELACSTVTGAHRLER